MEGDCLVFLIIRIRKVKIIDKVNETSIYEKVK